jgi:membrane-associated phospholipid phosphatase
MGQGDWGYSGLNDGAAMTAIFAPPLGAPAPKAAPVHPTLYSPAIKAGLSTLRLSPAGFPPGYWDPDFLAMLTIAELDPKEWTKIDILWPSPDPNPEIDQLIALQQTARADLMNEIIAQNGTFMADFLRLLMISQASHPFTYLLLKTGARLAELTMPFFKYKFNRPRPSQICPWIMPPLAVAGHPSYPQGHGLMAHLKALCVSEALPSTHAHLVDALTALAERIAWNRVVAGFHYPSDSVGARDLAVKLMVLVRKSTNFQNVVTQATGEWLKY